MKYFEFYNTVRIILGENALSKLPEELLKRGGKKALLISGPVLTRIGAVDKVKKVFEGTDAEIRVVFNAVPNDSSLEVVKEIVKVYKNHDCDCIIAAGGGSVMDTAKGVKLLLINNSEDLLEYTGMEMVGKGKNLPFAAIPTTSGTGSEVTKVSVIADLEKNVKMEFITGQILPDFCLLDPEMTKTLPRKATFTTAMDTLTHAIEGFTGSQSQPLSDNFALKAIAKFRDNMEKAVAEPENLEARMGMLESSMLAGIAFSNSMVGVVHGIGHAVGGVAHVGHDLAMAILLPACMKFNMSHLKEKYAEVLYYIAGEKIYQETKPEDRADRCVAYIEELLEKYNKEIGVPIKFRDAGVTEDQLPLIVRKALRDGALLANVKAVREEDVVNILKQSF